MTQYFIWFKETLQLLGISYHDVVSFAASQSSVDQTETGKIEIKGIIFPNGICRKLPSNLLHITGGIRKFCK